MRSLVACSLIVLVACSAKDSTKDSKPDSLEKPSTKSSPRPSPLEPGPGGTAIRSVDDFNVIYADTKGGYQITFLGRPTVTAFDDHPTEVGPRPAVRAKFDGGGDHPLTYMVDLVRYRPGELPTDPSVARKAVVDALRAGGFTMTVDEPFTAAGLHGGRYRASNHEASVWGDGWVLLDPAHGTIYSISVEGTPAYDADHAEADRFIASFRALER